MRVAIEKNKIFTKKIKSNVFLCVLEILYNICGNKKGSKWVSKETLKKLKNEKKILRYLFNKDKTVNKRKKKFLTTGENFKQTILTVLELFFEKCTETG